MRRFCTAVLARATVPCLLAILSSTPGAGAQEPPGTAPLAERVSAALDALPLAAGLDVRVRTDQGVVTLTGRVRTLADRQAVASTAEGVHGVGFVYIHLDVVPSRRLDGDELVQVARAALRDAEGTFEAPVLVDVEALGPGRVRVSGSVSTADDRHAVQVALKAVDGITAIEGSPVIDPREGLRSMELAIRKLLEVRQVAISDLELSLDGSHVVINGRAHDVLAREVLDEYVESIPGGRLVRDKVSYLVQPHPQD